MAILERPSLKVWAIETLKASIAGLRAEADDAKAKRAAIEGSLEAERLREEVHTAQADALEATLRLVEKQDEI